MEINKPVWTFKGFCPACGQGACLVFVVCPECGHLAIACDEEGTFFSNPFKLKQANVDVSASWESSAKCPNCNHAEIRSFAAANSDQIQKAGFIKDQYE